MVKESHLSRVSGIIFCTVSLGIIRRYAKHRALYTDVAMLEYEQGNGSLFVKLSSLLRDGVGAKAAPNPKYQAHKVEASKFRSI